VTFSAAAAWRSLSEFPELSAVMLGRGCAADPGLIRELALGEETDFQTFRAFHEKLLAAYRAEYSGDKFVLQKMKELWYYMSSMFPGSEKQVKRICKSQRCCDYAGGLRPVPGLSLRPCRRLSRAKKFPRFLKSPANSGLFAGDRAAPAARIICPRGQGQISRLWAISVFVRAHVAPKTIEFSFAAPAAKLCEAARAKKFHRFLSGGIRDAELLLFKHVLADAAQGQVKSAGRSSNLVPGAMPLAGSPAASSYS
jgi:hypothetical protein